MARSRRVLDAFLIVLVLVTAWRMFDGSRSDAPGTKEVLTPRALRQGDLLRWPGVEWSSRNVVLMLSSSCPACNANLPFYRRLASQALPGVGLLVVSAEPSHVIADWLYGSGVNVSNIHHLDDPLSHGLTLTPMIILADADGRVTDLMIRRLDERDQERVLNRIRHSAAPPLDNSQRVREILENDLTTLPDGAQVIDVRSRAQYANRHRPLARNIPMEELRARAAIELEPDAPVVIDCLQLGAERCRGAAWILVEAGFSDVSVLIR
jgi:rhodanese-related sulfurtransferase